MAVKYGRKKSRQQNLLFTCITALIICLVFLSTIGSFYSTAKEEAYEQLHLQTKQIKDDLQLQLRSDKENLITMANFAANLYERGEDYKGMLESFKPIGLIENIGILTPDNVFMLKTGQRGAEGRVSFMEEAKKVPYISGRVEDFLNPDAQLVRMAVPITVGRNTVGILYGACSLEKIGERYGAMADELNAQLFVYGLDTGDFIIDSVRDYLGNVSELKNREYKENFTYEELVENEKGFSSFVSAHSGKVLYIHYSPLEELGWRIMLARPEPQVFAKTHAVARTLIFTFAIILFVIIAYILFIFGNERRKSYVTKEASKARKLLLEINQQQENIAEALKVVQQAARSRSALFVDADGEMFKYILPQYTDLEGENRQYLVRELFRYASEFNVIHEATVNIMRIMPDAHLIETNKKFYDFCEKHNIREISLASIVDKHGHVSILGVINPKKSRIARALAEEIAVCFSIAIFNKKNFSRTEVAATTDSLTGVSNRMTYQKDIHRFNEEKPQNFACIYIDVNELHLCNNRYGHAAGDKMLVFVANTLKNIFSGQNIYRIGGDEFLVFAGKTTEEEIEKATKALHQQLKPQGYHVATGVSFRSHNTNTEEMVREAEVKMYEAKAHYYQNKEQTSAPRSGDTDYTQLRTGIREIDTMVSVMRERYSGIYRVSLSTDEVRRILMPSYLGYNENEEHFSSLAHKYIEEGVEPDFHRAMESFMNYDVIRRQLSEGLTPRIAYKKRGGERMTLSVYKINGEQDPINETLWVFAKE